jgi:hypothetical protein
MKFSIRAAQFSSLEEGSPRSLTCGFTTSEVRRANHALVNLVNLVNFPPPIQITGEAPLDL